jgi:deoxycytidine triphosphate deaminase
MLTDTEIRNAVENGELEVENTADFDEQLQSIGFDVRISSECYDVERDAVVRNGMPGVLTFEPGQFYNIRTKERLSLPSDMVGSVRPRVTISNSGLLIMVGSNIHPGYEGVLRFGVCNLRNETPIQIEEGHPIAQVTFERLSEAPETTYDERDDATYQGEENVESGPEQFS